VGVPEFRNPLKVALGLGSSRHGLGHWWVQRLTAIALIPLVVWFVVMVLSLVHSDYATARVAIAKPRNAVLLVTFLATAFWHGERGLQVVVEDWITSRRKQVALRVLIQFAAVLVVLSSLLAVLQIALRK
jgi:succinate dehydrogenase / fumarate reductase membrane anchor subunit